MSEGIASFFYYLYAKLSRIDAPLTIIKGAFGPRIKHKARDLALPPS